MASSSLRACFRPVSLNKLGSLASPISRHGTTRAGARFFYTTTFPGAAGLNRGHGGEARHIVESIPHPTPLYHKSQQHFQHQQHPSPQLQCPIPVRGDRYPKEIVFLGGAPGAGKGANSTHIAHLRKFEAPTIVVSDLLKTPACKILKDRGIMVDDDFVFEALVEELKKPIYSDGVVVDGFPRTTKQIELLHNFHKTHAHMHSAPLISFVMLHVDEATSISRQQARGIEALTLVSKSRSRSSTLPSTMVIPEIRATDLDVEASKARYVIFKEQFNAIVKLLGNHFPLIIVDASHSLEAVKDRLSHLLAPRVVS